MGKQDLTPRMLLIVYFSAYPPFPNNFLNLPIGTQGRSCRLNEGFCTGRQVLYHWATRKALLNLRACHSGPGPLLSAIRVFCCLHSVPCGTCYMGRDPTWATVGKAQDPTHETTREFIQQPMSTHNLHFLPTSTESQHSLYSVQNTEHAKTNLCPQGSHRHWGRQVHNF